MGILCDVDDEYDHQEVDFIPEEHHEPVEEVHGGYERTSAHQYVPTHKPHVPTYVPQTTVLRRSYVPQVTTLTHAPVH